MNKLFKRPFTLAFSIMSFALMIMNKDIGAFLFLCMAFVALLAEDD